MDRPAPGYQLPPQVMVDLIDAVETPDLSLSPDRRLALLLRRPALPPIADLARPELRLAGLRLDPATNGPSRATPFRSLALLPLDGGEERPVAGLPEDARVDAVAWSPDGRHLAFTVTGEHGIALWVAAVADTTARPLTPPFLNAADGPPFHWLPDSRSLIVKTVPAGRGDPPAPAQVPPGPVVQENAGKTAPARTYQDLLRSPYDEALFAHYLEAQVARVDLDGARRDLGAPALIRRAEPSPDGRYLLVETLHRPFSYLVPAERFPRLVEVWDAEGRLVRLLADLPLTEDVPVAFLAVPPGPRLHAWRSDAPATLAWLEAEDGGDPRREAAVRDRLFLLPAPFDAKPTPLLDLGLRFRRCDWGNDELALVTEWWWHTRQERCWLVRPARPNAEPRLLWERSWEDRYADPGRPLLRPNSAGRPVLLTAPDRAALYLAGDGASPEGDRPFLDRLDLATARPERLWRSQPPAYERPLALLDAAASRLLTRREAADEPPNYMLRDLADDSCRQLTHLPHPVPALAGVQKELIRYARADGVELTATLYLPPGYTSAAGPLPLLMWAYPHEFKNAAAAGQVADSPHRFVLPAWRSPLFWLTQGYAVLDNPAMPIVGEGEREPNDHFVAQLAANAEAAVAEVVRRGVAERGRIAIGGHSYGAFMTANLLAHTDLFCAGVARSGAYNRTLTPFGFQSEERTLWQAPEVYAAMSPFMHADKIKAPLLLIHGEADNNAGTFPLQSERLYAALKGHGATARLVLLPHESHAYRARESVLHMLWENTTWLDTYAMRPADARPAPE